jgi:hypothetical protein
VHSLVSDSQPQSQAPSASHSLVTLPVTPTTKRRTERPPRPKLLRGAHPWQHVLASLNNHFMIGGPPDQAVNIFRIGDHGILTPIGEKAFSLEVANLRAAFEMPDGTSHVVPAGPWWRKHPDRHQKVFVFKPLGKENARDEYNLWRGYGVEPVPGRDKMTRFLDHIWVVICRRDPAAFSYFMDWLRFCVQYPNWPAEVIVVLKSPNQGTGKSLVGNVMCRLLGVHADSYSSKEKIVGRFNAELAYKTFILGEEIMWAGDHTAADRLKSMATSPMLDLEAKFVNPMSVPNHLHIMLTTNHNHAVKAGVGDRRFFVLDVSEERKGDTEYFNAIYRDLNDGGYGQFLDFLCKDELGTWHPRLRPLTAETVRQIEYSGDSFDQWLQSCINADLIIGGSKDDECSFGKLIATQTLHELYSGFCRQHDLRPLGPNVFGKELTAMFGPHVRLPAIAFAESQHPALERRARGYNIPTSEAVQDLLNKRRGLKR